MRRIFLLAGETIKIESPQGTVAVQVTKDALMTSLELQTYDETLPNRNRFTELWAKHVRPIKNWTEMFKAGRPPHVLYDTFRGEE